MAASNPRSRGWCITLNNYTDAEYVHLLSIDSVYSIVGKEVCPITGTPHLQAYVYFKAQKTMSAVKMQVPRAHLEAAKGNHEQNRQYCSKDNNYVEKGKLPAHGERNDIKSAIATMKERGVKAVCEDHPEIMVKYSRGMLYVRDQVCPVPKRSCKTHLMVLQGPTGSGKSRLAAELAGEDVYYKPRGEWWDGYQQQSTVIIDDFYGWLQYDELLRLADRYPHKVPFKGGYHEFTSKLIVITSNLDPEEWYKFENYSARLPALKRRICVHETVAHQDDVLRVRLLCTNELSQPECIPRRDDDWY